MNRRDVERCAWVRSKTGATPASTRTPPMSHISWIRR